MRLLWRPDIAGPHPCRLTVHLDVFQVGGEIVEELRGPSRRDAEPFGEIVGRGRPVCVQVARNQGAQGPRTNAIHDRLGQLVDCQRVIRQRVPDGRICSVQIESVSFE